MERATVTGRAHRRRRLPGRCLIELRWPFNFLSQDTQGPFSIDARKDKGKLAWHMKSTSQPQGRR
ncbi:hypothetical protein CBM2631_A90286 [Cupriavidus taiwanensis]|nr:hypothetical protein CBM2631_A90286 [Cupriavidus taiwanensis]